MINNTNIKVNVHIAAEYFGVYGIDQNTSPWLNRRNIE